MSASPVQLLHQGVDLTAGGGLSRPLGIFFDRETGECYVADTGNHQIVIFDEKGMPVYHFYHHVTKNSRRTLGEPKGIAVDTRGRIFVTDAGAPYLDVLDHMGRQITAIDPPEDYCGGTERFEYLALAPNGKIYATLSCRKERVVAVIHPDLYVEELIQLRSADRSEVCTTGIGVDASDNIYVTDPCAPVMVQIYDSDGRYLRGFGRHDMGFENFSFPAGIVVMENGNMWVVDTIRQVASCFSPDGEFLTYVGGKGDGPGSFNYPSGLTSDGTDRLFVLERVGNRYQCFRILADPSTPEER